MHRSPRQARLQGDRPNPAGLSCPARCMTNDTGARVASHVHRAGAAGRAPGRQRRQDRLFRAGSFGPQPFSENTRRTSAAISSGLFTSLGSRQIESASACASTRS